MQTTKRTKRVLALASAASLSMIAMAAGAAQATPTPAPAPAPVNSSAQASQATWKRAFPIAAAPSAVHFSAHYFDIKGVRHTLEVWRNGKTFLHRRTDNLIDLYAVADQPGEETNYRLLDGRRQVAADVTRTNLYRIGIFSDSFGLAHALSTPREPYRIEAAQAPAGIAAEGCRWQAIVRTEKRPFRSLVCWSAQWGLPLVIVDADAAPKEVFRVDASDIPGKREVAASMRALPAVPAAYAQVDVNDEVDPSAD